MPERRNEAEADAARLPLLSQLRSPSWGLGLGLRRAPRTLIAPAAVFLLVAGIGAAVSYVAGPPEAADTADTTSYSVSGSGADGEMLASLTDIGDREWRKRGTRIGDALDLKAQRSERVADALDRGVGLQMLLEPRERELHRESPA